ncbi:MAG: ABC transporter ATP-binding protein [Breznakia sp.]
MIILENVSKTYLSNGKQVFKDINLKINSDDFAVLIDESGSGKSTLLKILGCLDARFEGMMMDAQRINSSSVDESTLAKIRKNKIGYIFQDFKLLNEYTIRQNLEIILSITETNDKDKVIQNALNEVNLSCGILDYFPYQLSGGQKQRIAIARALLKSPDVIIGDEITGALDKKNSNKIMNILTQLNHNGTIVIIATHDDDYITLGNRIIELKEKVVNERKK